MQVNENLDKIGKAMQAAWSRVKKSQSRMWGEWMTIGEGLLEGRVWAMRINGVNRPEGRGYVTAYAEWLKRYKVDDMDKSDRAKLLQLMEERAAVEEWRSTLTDYERRNLNNPVIVWRKWTAATRVKKPKSRTASVSASEMGRARATVEQQDERIRELQEELQSLRAKQDDTAVQNQTTNVWDLDADALASAMIDNLTGEKLMDVLKALQGQMKFKNPKPAKAKKRPRGYAKDLKEAYETGKPMFVKLPD
jgi:hypothetical protein